MSEYLEVKNNSPVVLTVFRGESGDSGSSSGVIAHNLANDSHPDLRALIAAKKGGYPHIQSSASTAWSITHNLGYKPSVTAFDSSDQPIQGTVINHSDNALTVRFATAISGSAYLI